MEIDIHMRRIIEMLLPKFFMHIPDKTVTSDILFPLGHPTPMFYQNMMTVLSVKRILIYNRWEKFCSESCYNALSTHKMYLRYVMFACEIEMKFSINVFDSLISVFALVINFNIETLINSGADFCELSVDMFMAFYKMFLKESFDRQGGFEQLSEYLRQHEYLPWENYMRNEHDIYGRSSFLRNLYDKTEKQFQTLPHHSKFIKHGDVLQNTNCEYLAKEVLRITKIKLPMLTNSDDLKVRLRVARQQKAEVRKAVTKHEMAMSYAYCEPVDAASKRKTLESTFQPETGESVSKQKSMEVTSNCETMEIFLQRCANLDFVTQTNNVVEQKLRLDWCQNLVRRFVEYKSSRNSDPSDTNNHIPREEDKFLNQLKNKIIYWIEKLEN